MSDHTRPPFGFSPKNGADRPWWEFGPNMNAASLDDMIAPVTYNRHSELGGGTMYALPSAMICSREVVSALAGIFGDPCKITYCKEAEAQKIKPDSYTWNTSTTIVNVYVYDSRATCVLYSINKEDFEQVCSILLSCPVKSRRGALYIAIKSQGSVSLRSISHRYTKSLNPDNYTPEICSKYKRALEDIQSRTPRGRLLLLEGPPGGGKAFMVKNIIAETAANFVVVNPSNFEDLMGTEFLSAITSSFDTESTPLVLVMEDADKLLKPRGTDVSLSGLSSVLNLGDGILSEAMRIHLIATTNTPLETIDEALLRPGRLSERIHVGPLPGAQAASVYERLLPGQKWESGDATLAEIYAKAKENGWQDSEPVEIVPADEEWSEEPLNENF